MTGVKRIYYCFQAYSHFILKCRKYYTCGPKIAFNTLSTIQSEAGGILEPPVTPVGRDELALKRHRFFADLLAAAHAAADHRVRFNPLGPEVALTTDEHFSGITF